MAPSDDDRERFERLFRSCAPRVHAYVRRHAAPALVNEVVSETFLIAWRRRDRVPVDDPVPWLLVCARHTLANVRRGAARSEPAQELLEAAAARGVDGAVVDRAAALAALATLTEREREAVLLVAWDGLDVRGAARVAGCSPRAFTVRLHRARQRLARALDPPAPSDAAPTPSRPTRGPAVRLAEEAR